MGYFHAEWTSPESNQLSVLKPKVKSCLFFFFCFCFVFLAISWAAPAAYGGSQARGRIGAVTIGLRQSHSNLHHSSRQRRIVNPLSKGRDRTRDLMVPSRIR